MKHEQKAWLVAYDICHPRRLRRVHRQLRKEGVPAQYSAFTVQADDEQMRRLLERLRLLLVEAEDDLRAYHLPISCTVWSLGQQHWPQGISLNATHAARLLTGLVTQPHEASTEVQSTDEPSTSAIEPTAADPAPSG